MSKRYPPIFNVILFAVAVCIIIINPMTMPMPWISAVTSFIVFAVSSIFGAVVYVYNRYAIFAIHIVIIMLYAKQLFGKEAKAKYHETIKLVDAYKQSNDEEEYREVHCKLVDALAPLYIESTLVLIVVALNIIFPNFYQFTLLQINWFSRVDVTTDAAILVAMFPMMTAIVAGFSMLFGILFATFKANSMLYSKAQSEIEEQ